MEKLTNGALVTPTPGNVDPECVNYDTSSKVFCGTNRGAISHEDMFMN